jgi:MFS family permease
MDDERPTTFQPTSLWRESQFRSFWGGQTISQLGDQVTLLALPLIAATTLHASANQVARLTALAWTPNLFAFILGTLIDQTHHHKWLMVAADGVRAAALLSLPVTFLWGSVTLIQLYVVALLAGAAEVLFNTAYPAFFAQLVTRSSYLDANAKLSASRSASYMAGPAIGGALVQWLTASVAVAVDAVSFLVSAVLVGRIRINQRAPLVVAGESSVALHRRAAEGLTFVLRDPILRASLGCATTINFFTFVASSGLMVLFASRELSLAPGVIGLAFGVGATGALLGALLAPKLSRLIGVGRSVVVGAILYPAPIAIAAFASGPMWLRAAALGTAEFFSGIGVMLFDVNLNSLKTAVIPDPMRSRVAGAFNTINYGIRPLGAIAGGLLSTLIGLRGTLLIAASGGTLAALWLFPSPIPGVRSIDRDALTR